MYWETDWLAARSRLTPDKAAAVDVVSEIRWTFRQLNERAVQLAATLSENGIVKGDRIALLSPNNISYFDLLFACGKLGAIFVPLNWRLSTVELSFILEDCQPRLLAYHDETAQQASELETASQINVCSERYESWITGREATESFPEIQPRDPWCIIYTGGTTGRPKGVVLSHLSMGWNAVNTIISWQLTAEDVTLTYLPMFHTGGLNALTLPILLVGGKVVIGRQFDAKEAMRLLNKERCTITLMVPTMYHLLVNDPVFDETDFPTMKTFLSGGASCPHTIYEVFEKRGIAFKEGYGLTEAGPNNFFIDPKQAACKHGCVGKPMMLNTVKVVDDSGWESKDESVGELLIQGHHLFDHYWNRPEATAEALADGWLHTGDLAKRDPEGDYYILGRKKDMVITGGENVYPFEVETIISDLEAVSEVAVVGLPDEKWGEVVAAFIVVKSNRTLSENVLKNHCVKFLGKYKIPKRWFFIEELPKTDVGKIDKKAIVERYRKPASQ